MKLESSLSYKFEYYNPIFRPGIVVEKNISTSKHMHWLAVIIVIVPNRLHYQNLKKIFFYSNCFKEKIHLIWECFDACYLKIGLRFSIDDNILSYH